MTYKFTNKYKVSPDLVTYKIIPQDLRNYLGRIPNLKTFGHIHFLKILLSNF